MKKYVLVLWFCCVLRTINAQDGMIFRRYQPIGKDVSSKTDEEVPVGLARYSLGREDSAVESEIPESEIVYDENGKPRDKRMLGVIIQGIANAFGYTLTPLQIASLPNAGKAVPAAPAPAPPPKIPIPNPILPTKAPPPAATPARGPAAPPPKTPRGPAPPPPPPPKPPAPSAKAPASPPPQRQRETIRITGLLNFGQNANSDIPTQLRQYEQTIHGNAYSPPALGLAPASAATPAAPPAPLPEPSLAKIPSPIVPNLKPLLPPTLPPRPSQPATPAKQEIETEYKNRQNVENYRVESKEIVDEKELLAQLATPGYGVIATTATADWREAYQEKLRELEERQKEYAEKLRRHEEQLAKQQQDHENTDERFKNRESEIAERERERIGEIERSREGKQLRGEPNESLEEVDEEAAKYGENDSSRITHRPPSRDYEEGAEKYYDYDETPGKYSGYGKDYEEKLPISTKSQMPQSQIQNSYGESLEAKGKVNENVADYFIKFKDPATGLYDAERTQNPENYKSEKPWWKEKQDELEEDVDKLRAPYSAPEADFKYEEYELPNESGDDGTPEKQEELREDADPTPASRYAEEKPGGSEKFDDYEAYQKNEESEGGEEIGEKAPRRENSEAKSQENSSAGNADRENSEAGEAKSAPEEGVPRYEFDFKNFAPYYSPIQYFYNTDDAESTETPLKSSEHRREEHETERPDEKAFGEQVERSEGLQPTRGLPERPTMKSLHEGESKELRAWPAPFDYVFDSTEQTNVAELPRIENSPETQRTTAPQPDYEEAYQEPKPSPFPIKSALSDYDAFFSRQNSGQVDHRRGHYVNDQGGTAGSDYEQPRVGSDREQEDYRKSQKNREQYAESPSNRARSRNNYSSPKDSQHRYGEDDAARVNRGRDESARYIRPHRPHDEPRYETGRQEKSIETRPSKNELRNRGANFAGYYTPGQTHHNGRGLNEADDDEARRKQLDDIADEPRTDAQKKFEDPTSAHDFFGFSKNDYDYENDKINGEAQPSREPQSSDGNDRTGELIVPNLPAYQHDERLTEFTVEPETDTEKVKVKEYRNKFATVTVSEQKQLSPEGPTHLFGYTQHY